METTDILVVGAGPTGLLMAYQLARMGVGTCIIGILPQSRNHTKLSEEDLEGCF